MKWIGIVSLFPDMFRAITEHGVTGRAVKNELVSLNFWDPRDFTTDRHRTVDDRPFGGGPGMVMKFEPLRDAIRAAKQAAGEGVTTIYLSPQGTPLTQSGVESLAQRDNLILVCGRYEGIDERIIQSEVDEEWSVGDFVLSGGELAAMAMIDSVIRLVPGALGHELSAVEDSFTDGLLDCPHYTRPEEIDGIRVPEVLLSGNHALIRRWRRKEALGRTWLKRPDLLAATALTPEDTALLGEFQRDYAANGTKP